MAVLFLEKIATVVYKCLANLCLADSYPLIMGWLACTLKFSLLGMCSHVSRSNPGYPAFILPAPADFKIAESRLFTVFNLPPRI